MNSKIKIFLTVVFILIILLGISKFKMSNPKVLIKTNLGEIEVELYPDKAPITVENFLSYVKEGTYKGTVFHRVIKDFMIQGGGFTSEGEEKPTKAPIKLESSNRLSNKKGTISMARTMVADSATNQFFINTVDNNFLDYSPQNDGYAVFGKVTSGMEIVEKIEASKTTTKLGMNDWPVEDILIENIEILEWDDIHRPPQPYRLLQRLWN